MQKRIPFALLILTLICCMIISGFNRAEARGMSAVNLNMIPTANTLGKGGYSFWAGMFPYNLETKTISPISIDIGGFFKERHDVKLQSDIWLIPSRITYGITERLDFTFGGTYASGDTEKTITDYYEIGDDSKERVYPQVVLDGILGMKYNIEKGSESLPAMAFGGEIQMGYTVDDDLVDETLEDSFQFVGALIYMSASYDLQLASVHGGLGMYLSSKSIQSSKRFDLPIQIGAEIPFNSFAAVVDLTLFQAFSGVGLENIVSGGLRYDISSNATLNAGVASVGGFFVRLTIGGKRPESTAPPPSAPSLF